MAKNKGTPIVILGMHRSGTSLLASMLHRIGISMGQEFLDSDQFNTKGYFEDVDFLWINKGILESSGGIWYAPPQIDEILEGDNKFEEIIKDTIARKRKLAGRNSWGWKDPRTCLTCWKFAEEIPDAKFIIIVRKLNDIKKSLNNSHGHVANWDKLIDTYYSSIDQFFDNYPNELLSVGFEELVYEKYAEKTVAKIVRFVGKSDLFIHKAMSIIQFR